MTLISTARSIVLWQRLDLAGHELCELSSVGDWWRLTGVALLAQDERPCRFEYEIECDASWETRRARVWGQIDGVPAAVMIDHASGGDWKVNDVIDKSLAGCIDVDFGFSPCTNLLPIRRLGLPVGSQSAVRAAWVRFPELTVETLEQTYTRTGTLSYHYESAGGAFQRDLTVNSAGFVVDYPGIWRAEAVTQPHL